MEINKPWTKFYDLGVPESYEYPNITLADLLEVSTERNPYKTAIIHNDNHITYSDLNNMVNSFALSLLDLGLEPGDRVMLALLNLPETVVAYYGSLRAGLMVVNCNPLFTEAETEFILRDAGAKAVVTMDFLAGKFANLTARTELKHIITVSLSNPQVSDNITFRDMLKQKGLPPKLTLDPAEGVALLQYTGGTTGTAKGVMLTHRNLIANTVQIAGVSRAASEDLFLSIMPFFHVYGMTTSMNIPIMFGATFIPYANPRDVEGVLTAITEYQPTLLYAVPTMYANMLPILLRTPGKYDLSSIRLCISGGAPLPNEVRNNFENLTGRKMREALGMTEGTTGCSCSPCCGLRKDGVGVPFPDVLMATVDEKGQFLPPGAPGELVLKGPNVMKGYWNNPEATKAAFVSDGWVRTGDIVQMDEDGYFTVIDRVKDMIITSGYNVYTLEVENVIYQHPGVMEAAVVGVPHPTKGESVKAFVVAKTDSNLKPEDIVAFCQEQLAPYKVPREVEFLNELPKSNVGKILKRELRSL